MDRLYRSLVGLSVIGLLLPVAAVTFPGVFDGRQPQAVPAVTTPADNGGDPFTTTEAEQQLPAHSHPDPELDGTTMPAPTAETTTGHDEPPAHTHPPSSTTTHQSENRGGTTPDETADVITGAACPCTVSGTATLRGKVSLQGDLIVDGGTLVARAGVEVGGNGHQIMFMNGGKADFQGTPTPTWSGDGSNQNLKRDISFNNMRRIMFHMGAGVSVLKYLTVSNSGTSALGDYPLHWHLNGNSTRGTIVEGVVVLNGRHHAFVPHGSHGITFKDTIAKNTAGDAYWWDPPGSNESCSFQKFCTLDNSNDIVYDRALADGVQPMPGSKGHRVAGFHLGAGSGNVVRNSVAINIKGGVDCSGFHWPESANQNEGGNVWEFQDNRSHSSSGCHGIFVWQNDSNRHVIDGFLGGGIDHGAYVNHYEYRNVDVPYMEVHAAGLRVKGGRIGTVYAKRHINGSTPTARFEDVAIKRFVILNAQNGGDVPGSYELNNTDLTCDEIEYDVVVAGTKVLINGEEC